MNISEAVSRMPDKILFKRFRQKKRISIRAGGIKLLGRYRFSKRFVWYDNVSSNEAYNGNFTSDSFLQGLNRRLVVIGEPRSISAADMLVNHEAGQVGIYIRPKILLKEFRRIRGQRARQLAAVKGIA